LLTIRTAALSLRAENSVSLAEISLGSGIGAIMRLDKKQVVNIAGDVTGRLANDVIKEND
jgi:hypothetical protein